MHTNDKAEDYFSYADSIGKNLAFLPFTKVKYKLEKPDHGVQIFFSKNNTILVLNSFEKAKEVTKSELLKYLLELKNDKSNQIYFCHDQNCSYEQFLQNSIFSSEFKLQLPVYKITNEEFIF